MAIVVLNPVRRYRFSFNFFLLIYNMTVRIMFRKYFMDQMLCSKLVSVKMCLLRSGWKNQCIIKNTVTLNLKLKSNFKIDILREVLCGKTMHKYT